MNTTAPTDLLQLMTSARSAHDRAIASLLHRLWQAALGSVFPAQALDPARRTYQTRLLNPTP